MGSEGEKSDRMKAVSVPSLRKVFFMFFRGISTFCFNGCKNAKTPDPTFPMMQLHSSLPASCLTVYKDSNMRAPQNT